MSRNLNSFSVLGVSPGASHAEIKRAYRRLAQEWHPDRNSHPQAAERFMQIRSAYETLQGRSSPEPSAWSPASRPKPPQRAADIRLDLELTLEEAIFGCKKEVIFSEGTPCAACGGKGETVLSRSHMCGACHGSGRIRQKRGELETCEECDGRGFFRDHTCAQCGGKGLVGEPEGVRVPVPPGLMPGEQLRIAGKGEPGRGDILPGDLYLKVSILPHPLFRLDGDDISFEMPINGFMLLAGGSVGIPVPGGVDMLEIEPGSFEKRSIRVPSKGYPRRDSAPGDLVVHLRPILPAHLDAEQRQLLQAAAAACEQRLDDSLPEVAAWRKRYGC